MFDGDIPADDKSSFGEAVLERVEKMALRLLSAAAEPAHQWHSRLLRARRQRPRCCRAAKQRDELAASDESCHLIPPAGRLWRNHSTSYRRALG
jgi:hypothetical protein